MSQRPQKEITWSIFTEGTQEGNCNINETSSVFFTLSVNGAIAAIQSRWWIGYSSLILVRMYVSWSGYLW